MFVQHALIQPQCRGWPVAHCFSVATGAIVLRDMSWKGLGVSCASWLLCEVPVCVQ